ncbi:hypothetical protein MJC1_04129 [Methylocystis sp. MJC1]|nr:hypothetical protein MJC1_04129 [Methylocystis sp. MJC1]
MGEKFGWNLAADSRRRSPHRADKWHLDEVVVSIVGKKHWLWRAVDADGFVLAILAQSRRDKKAAKRLMRKLLKNAGRAPRVMVTDKLKSYGSARAAMGLRIKHRQHNGLNSRAENSHQPTRRREGIMKRSKSARQAQKFLSIHHEIANLFHHPYPECKPAATRRSHRADALRRLARDLQSRPRCKGRANSRRQS